MSPCDNHTPPVRMCVVWIVVAAAMLVALLPSSASAHGAPIPIAIWGGFPPDVAHCQRIVARSADACASQAWALSDACLRAQLDGEPCDRSATAAAIEQAHTRALADANSACRNVDFQSLGYFSLVDMNVDIDVFCQDLQNAMVSAVYGPVLQHGEIQPVDAPTRRCIGDTAVTAERLREMSFRSHRRVFDRIASAEFTPSEKFALIGRSTMSIDRVRTLLQTQLNSDCPAFASIYGRTVTPFLTRIATRADCLAGRVYVQDFVLCPPAVCGNGMQEPTEGCDDGNRTSGDGCRNDCRPE